MLKTIKMPNEYRQLKNYLPPKNYKELKVIKYSRTQFFNTIGAINEHQQKTTSLLPKINNTVGQINEKKKAPYLSIKMKKKKGLKKNKSVDAKEVMDKNFLPRIGGHGDKPKKEIPRLKSPQDQKKRNLELLKKY